MSQKYPKISIIFPTHNGWQDTKECLQSIAKLDYPQAKLEVIIVDNASTDGSPELVKQFQTPNRPKTPNTPKLPLKLIANKKNLGFAKAVNQGVKKAKGEFIFITNNDIVFEKDSLKALLETHQKTKNIGLMGPKILFKDSHKLAMAGFRVNLWLGYSHYDKNDAQRKREIEYISGCGMFLKKGIFEKLGGFDPHYFFYFEDLDFCLRLRKAGYKIIYEPKAVIYHGYAKTAFRQRLEIPLYQGYHSRFYCLFKNASLLQILISLFAVPLLALVLEIKSLNDPPVRGKIFPSMIKGLTDNLKYLSKRLRLKI